MKSFPGWIAAAAVVFISTHFVSSQAAKYSIKPVEEAPPKDLKEDVAKLLSHNSVQLLDSGGKEVAQVWLRKDVPALATPEQIKNGITYRELRQSEILGAIQFTQDALDYRKQKVKAGTYTLRLGFQPQDGDHAGSSESQDFVVVIDAAKDAKPEHMEPKEMVEASARSIGTGHPGVFMLYPGKNVSAPALESRPRNHWVLNTKTGITSDGKPAGSNLGISLVLIGASE